MTWPIYIPSKSRALTAKTPRLLEAADIPYCLVLEKEEMGAYIQADYQPWHYLMLPDSNRGIGYARNFILHHAREQGEPWVWIIDDDILHFATVANHRCVRDTAAVLRTMEKQIAALPEKSVEHLAMIGPEYRETAWKHDHPFIWNSYCFVAIGVQPQLLAAHNIAYDEKLLMMEDCDFALQILTNGLSTLRFAYIAFDDPEQGSKPGGMQWLYKIPGKPLECARAMIEKWGSDLCSVSVKRTGIGVAVKWRLFRIDAPQYEGRQPRVPS
jgi:TET-Associated Glycosyltransferase